MSSLQWFKEAMSAVTVQTTDLPFSLFPSTLIFLFVLTILILPLSRLIKSNRKPSAEKFNLPPGPPKLPIIGNLHQLSDQPHRSLLSLCRKYGPIIHLQLGEIPTVVVSSARLAKEVMKTHDHAIASRPQIFGAKHLMYNCTDVGFSPYGAYWRHIRKICVNELLNAKRVQSFSYIREDEVARMVRRIAESYPGTTNLSKMMALYANNMVCRTAFGIYFSEGGEYDQYGFQTLLEEFQLLLGGFSLGDYFPSKEWIHTVTGMKSRLVKTTRGFNRFFDEIIKEHQMSLRSNKSKVDYQKDLVDVLLEVQKDDMTLTMDNIKAVIMDMFAAGNDQNFTILDWGMTELITNPRVMEKAQTEIRTILGDRKTVLEADLPQMHYLKSVIKEILRMHPASPILLPRESMEDVTIDGYEIPAKTRFIVNAWAIGRDPKSWENPDTFQPERFMDSSLDYKGQDFEFIPFGSGRRSCPGIDFAIAGLELPFAQLLHSFEWELPYGIKAEDLDMTEVFGVTTHRIASLIVIAKPRFKY